MCGRSATAQIFREWIKLVTATESYIYKAGLFPPAVSHHKWFFLIVFLYPISNMEFPERLYMSIGEGYEFMF